MMATSGKHLKFGDVFRSLNVAYGIEERRTLDTDEGNNQEKEIIIDNTPALNSISHQEEEIKQTFFDKPPPLNSTLEDEKSENYIDLDIQKMETNAKPVYLESYFEFCKPLLDGQSIKSSKGLKNSMFVEDEAGNDVSIEELDVVAQTPANTVVPTNDSNALINRTFLIPSKNNQELFDEVRENVVANENVACPSKKNVAGPEEVVANEHLASPSTKNVTAKKKLVKRGDRLQRDKLNHPLLPPCDCKNKCITKIDQKQRENINAEFWKLDYNERLTFLGSRVRPLTVKRRKKDSKGERQRNESFVYSFFVSEDIKVCQIFFLRTLGFKSNKVLLTAMQKSKDGLLPTPDQRGKTVPSNKFSDEHIADIRNHIMSYDPRISHYRRVHAPRRLYLPSGLTIAAMHKNYLDSGGNCSYESYRKEVALKNISFAALGCEECETCLEYKEHECTKTTGGSDGAQHENASGMRECTLCISYEKHKERAKHSRLNYKEDALKVNTDSEAYFSVDLQKVIMLPRLPGVKTVAFTKRIIAFNETFAPLGDKRLVKQKKAVPVAMTWHQAEGGRSAQEICSVYCKFFNAYRDVENFTFWVDNCSSQNKCWFLYTAICHAVNSGMNEVLQSITFKYFERGHSFMSADSYHHLVEKAMNEKRNVYDFQEFVDILNINGQAIKINSEDFVDFPRGVSNQSKFSSEKPLIDDISVAKFQRGSTKIFWKENFKSDFKSAEFLQKKIANRLNKGNNVFPRLYPFGAPGVAISRKQGILKNLLDILPVNRRAFWLNLKHVEIADAEEDDE